MRLKYLKVHFRKTIFVAGCLAFLSTGLFFYHLYTSRPRIAYVRSVELIYSYNGMKEAHAEFKQQTAQWQANIDTLKLNYLKFQSEIAGLPLPQRKEKDALLAKMQEDIEKYTSVINNEAKEKEASLTQSVLNQVNSYVESYAKKKGYDLVLGSEHGGSIIYGAALFDITDEVLEELNKEHKSLPEIASASAVN